MSAAAQQEPSWLDPSNDEEQCLHPNGFGVDGCPCGATAPDGDQIEPTWPKLSSYEDGQELPQLIVSKLDSEELFEYSGNFEDFWLGWVKANASTIAAKAEEYGSNSLAEMGALFARQGGQTQLTQAEALEKGCAVYAFGKMQRVVDAMLKGNLPGIDTLEDIMVYAAMSLYIRETKQWP